jgi:hypothetical protein
LQFTSNSLTILFVQALLGGLNNPVTQSEACSALASLLEVLKPVIDQYLPLVITPLCLLLQTGTPTLKPTAVNAIGTAAHVSNEKFLPYFPNVMAWFRYFLLHFSHDHELRTAVMTSVGRLARAVGCDTFRPYLPEISKGAFEGIKTGNENVSKGCFTFLETLSPSSGNDAGLYASFSFPPEASVGVYHPLSVIFHFCHPSLESLNPLPKSVCSLLGRVQVDV